MTLTRCGRRAAAAVAVAATVIICGPLAADAAAAPASHSSARPQAAASSTTDHRSDRPLAIARSSTKRMPAWIGVSAACALAGGLAFALRRHASGRADVAHLGVADVVTVAARGPPARG